MTDSLTLQTAEKIGESLLVRYWDMNGNLIEIKIDDLELFGLKVVTT